MFEQVQERFQKLFKRLRGVGRLTEANIQEALREVRIALLEADVNLTVTKDFLNKVKERALGKEVMASVTPAQQFIKVVHDELTALMGGQATEPRLPDGKVRVIALFGLQGSGKTTTAGKLAFKLKQSNLRPLLVGTDVRRPAAVEQLGIVAQQAEVAFFPPGHLTVPLEVAKKALQEAEYHGYDPVIIDTAGRLHIDEDLMTELKSLVQGIRLTWRVLVADAMTGQDAVNQAERFHKEVGLEGVILTKLDSDTRGGAALSIRAVTSKPILYVGVGEKLADLEIFYPERMASRILGMGDIVSLVEKAEAALDEKKAQELEKRLSQAQFTLEDFLDQIRQIKRMGGLSEVLSMLPGMGHMKGVNVDDSGLKKIEAIICSMTKAERRNPRLIDGARRRRIAAGSGTTVQDINRLLNQYEQMKKMLKRFSKDRKFARLFPF